MVRELAKSWLQTIENRIFSPPCGRPECRSSRLLRWQKRIRIQDVSVCSLRCVEREVRAVVERLLFVPPTYFHPAHRVPLGLLMLAHGDLEPAQLQTALRAQQAAGRGRIGAWLQMLHFASEQQVVSALGVQWACPPLLMRGAPDAECSDLLPFPLLQALHLMPICRVAASRLLYLAVSERVDYSVLSAIERVADFKTVPCLISDRVMKNLLASVLSSKHPVQQFDYVTDAAELARITSSYIGRLGAERVCIVRCGPYLWARLKNRESHTDLLFSLVRSTEGRIAEARSPGLLKSIHHSGAVSDQHSNKVMGNHGSMRASSLR